MSYLSAGAARTVPSPVVVEGQHASLEKKRLGQGKTGDHTRNLNTIYMDSDHISGLRDMHWTTSLVTLQLMRPPRAFIPGTAPATSTPFAVGQRARSAAHGSPQRESALKHRWNQVKTRNVSHTSICFLNTNASPRIFTVNIQTISLNSVQLFTRLVQCALYANTHRPPLKVRYRQRGVV